MYNFKINTQSGAGISSSGDLTIVLTGTNSITSSDIYGISAEGNISISGNGSLTAQGSAYSIYSGGNIDISGCSVSAASTSGFGFYASNNISISDSEINTSDICGGSSITISGDVDITAVGGIDSDSNSITPATGGILEVTVGSTTSYISSATTLSSTYDTVTIKNHTHSYVNNECACGAKDYGTVTVGYATLQDGQYTENGKQFSVQDGTPTGTTYAYYSGGVLYLSNFEYEDENMYAVYALDDLSIELSGTNTIVGYFSIFGDLSISGSGSLTLTSENGAGDWGKIYAENITIEDTTLNITVSGNSAIGISSNGDFAISGSTINVTTTSTGKSDTDVADAILSLGNIIIDEGSSITATATATGAGASYGIHAAYNITIEDSTVTVTSTATSAAAYGIVAEYYDISISGDVNITSSAGIESQDGNVMVTPTTGETLAVLAGTSASEITERWYLSTSFTDTNDTRFTSGKYISIAPSAAHTHSYSDTWNWAEDYSSATVTFSCSGCSETWSGENVEITTDTVAATCTSDGSITYTAKVTFEGEEYTDMVTVDGAPATGHSYTVTWTWNGSRATATYTCNNCNESTEVESTVTSVNVFGMITYTATATHDGVTETTTKTSGINLLVIGALTQTEPEEVTSEEVDTEEVEIVEPVESTDTEAETDEETPEPEAETNPTTGAVAAMLPVAMAIAAFVVGKKRLG